MVARVDPDPLEVDRAPTQAVTTTLHQGRTKLFSKEKCGAQREGATQGAFYSVRLMRCQFF